MMENKTPCNALTCSASLSLTGPLNSASIGSRLTCQVYPTRRLPLSRRENWAVAVYRPRFSNTPQSICESQNSCSDEDSSCSTHYHANDLAESATKSDLRQYNTKSAAVNDHHDNDSRDSESNTSLNRQKRKPSKPCRSADRDDATFNGVTIQLRTLFYSDETQLAISAHYHCKRLVRRRLKKPVRRATDTHWLSRSPSSCLSNPVSAAHHGHQTSHSSNKQCISCGTKKTPLWRDTEDGTPLCNACGIRYKKYRIRCSFCWHIPKKDTKLTSSCHDCGNNLRYRSW